MSEITDKQYLEKNGWTMITATKENNTYIAWVDPLDTANFYVPSKAVEIQIDRDRECSARALPCVCVCGRKPKLHIHEPLIFKSIGSLSSKMKVRFGCIYHDERHRYCQTTQYLNVYHEIPSPLRINIDGSFNFNGEIADDNRDARIYFYKKLREFVQEYFKRPEVQTDLIDRWNRQITSLKNGEITIDKWVSVVDPAQSVVGGVK